MNISSLLYVLAFVGASAAATLQTPPATVPANTIRPNTYFAVFKGEAGTPEAQRDYQRFQEQLRTLGVKITPRAQFTELLNAASFEMDDADLLRVASIDSVKEIYPMLKHTPPRVIRQDVQNPQLKYTHGVTGVKEVHDTLGLTGKGIKVGVIDTGIDYKHPALGGCYGKGCRVAYGHDFVGDDYNEADPAKTKPVPDEDPMDCGGHGTHVAGIIGAKDKDFVGVGPEVTFGAYRVFGCEGSTSTDIIIQAMERALKDGMDVINLSLGGGSSWAGYPSSIAADKLSKKGMIVVSAMGNDGDKGMFQASSPAMSNVGFGVASTDNFKYEAYGFTVDGQKDEFDYSSGAETGFPFKNTEIASGKNEENDEACKPITADVKGKIVLVKRGNCLFVDKAKNVQAAGGIATLIYNKDFGGFAPSVDDPTVKIPVAGIPLKTGQRLLELLAKGKTTLTFSTNKKAYDNPTGGKISSFSSWGPGPELEIKPDISAPGGLILSTWPLKLGGYITISGTSMATPYTAGSVALYLQKHGKTNPADVRDVFKVTAQPITELGTTNITPAIRQGGGLIQVKDALLTTTHISPAMLPILSSDVKTGKLKPITITNKGKYAKRYIISHKPALAVQAWDHATGELLPKPVYQPHAVKVDISTKEITLRPGQSEKINVFFSAPSNLNINERWLLSGYIYITPKPTAEDLQNGVFKTEPSLSVPYGGMHGDYSKVSILTKPESGLPAVFSPTTGKPAGANDVFSLTGDDKPTLVVRILHPTKHMLVKVIGADGKELGVATGSDSEYTGRSDNSEKNLSTQITWDGTVMKAGAAAEAVKDGKYKLKLLALRPFGKKDNAADYQSWVSSDVTINRTKATESKAVEGLEGAIRDFVRGKASAAPLKNNDRLVLPQPFNMARARE